MACAFFMWRMTQYSFVWTWMAFVVVSLFRLDGVSHFHCHGQVLLLRPFAYYDDGNVTMHWTHLINIRPSQSVVAASIPHVQHHDCRHHQRIAKIWFVRTFSCVRIYHFARDVKWHMKMVRIPFHAALKRNRLIIYLFHRCRLRRRFKNKTQKSIWWCGSRSAFSKFSNGVLNAGAVQATIWWKVRVNPCMLAVTHSTLSSVDRKCLRRRAPQQCSTATSSLPRVFGFCFRVLFFSPGFGWQLPASESQGPPWNVGQNSSERQYACSNFTH